MKKYHCQKGDTYQVSWIPEKYAKVGKYVKLKDDDGWEVIEVGTKKILKKYKKDQ